MSPQHVTVDIRLSKDVEGEVCVTLIGPVETESCWSVGARRRRFMRVFKELPEGHYTIRGTVKGIVDGKAIEAATQEIGVSIQ
jgi:hypothetical protein